MVLLAQRVAVREPHADVFIGANDGFGLGFRLPGIAGNPAVQMLRRGRAGGHHLETGIKRVVIGDAVADRDAGREPKLERCVGYAELDCRQADMMMRVDETRQQHLLAIAYDRRARIVPMQICEGADRRDHAILLENRAVIDLLPAMTVERARNNIFPANDRGGNGAPLSIFISSRLTELPARRTRDRPRLARAMSAAHAKPTPLTMSDRVAFCR